MASVQVSGLGWLSLVSLLVYAAFYALAWGSLPWLIAAELLSVRAKSLAGGVVTVSNWMFSFIITVRRSAVGGPELRRFLAVCRSLSIRRSVRVFLRSKRRRENHWNKLRRGLYQLTVLLNANPAYSEQVYWTSVQSDQNSRNPPQM